MIRRTSFVLLLFSLVAASGVAQDQARDNYIPSTISPEAQQTLKAIYDAKAYARVFPAADDVDGWRRRALPRKNPPRS